MPSAEWQNAACAETAAFHEQDRVQTRSCIRVCCGFLLPEKKCLDKFGLRGGRKGRMGTGRKSRHCANQASINACGSSCSRDFA